MKIMSIIAQSGTSSVSSRMEIYLVQSQLAIQLIFITIMKALRESPICCYITSTIGYVLTLNLLQTT